MKRIANLLLALSLTVCMLLALPIGAAAANTETKNGLEVTVITDKDEYTADEDIQVSVNIKNNNTYMVEDVFVEALLPEGLVLKSGNLSTADIDIESGKTYLFSLVAQLSDEFKKTTETEPENTTLPENSTELSDTTKNENTTEPNDTTVADDTTTEESGGKSNIVLWVVLGVVFVAAIVAAILLIFKFKHKTKVISLFLCIATVLTVIPISDLTVEAGTATVTVDKIITVDGIDYTVSINVKFNPEDNTVVLSDFKSDEIYFVCGEKSKITFSVKSDSNINGITLLKNNNETVGVMHDDGLNGDLVANDNVFTLVATETVTASSLQTYNYYCKANSTQSDKISVYYFPKLTQTSAVKAKEDYEYVQQQIANIENQYSDADGYVKKANRTTVVNKIADESKQWISDGKVLHCVTEDCSVYIKFTSGLASIYEPALKNTDSVGVDTQMRITTCQPTFTEMGGEGYSTNAYELPDGVNYVLEMIDDSAFDIDNSFNNYTFPSAKNYDDENVTLDVIKSFGSNQIILWHGHGYYGPIVKSSLATGEAFNWNAYFWDTSYFNDCVANRFVNSLVFQFDNVIITSKYIDYYCGNMNNSLLYLAACDSGKSDELANAFLRKGAAAVVANSNKIIREYNVAMLYETMSNMQTVNRQTGNYYTLSEALVTAKAKYGNSDADLRYGGVGAKPLIFGGNIANNYRLRNKNDERGTLSGKICKASDRITAIPNASIKVYKNGTLYTSSTSNSTGNYSISLPEGRYSVLITSNGYIDFKAYADVTVNENTYMETFLMIKGSTAQSGTASGKVINSLTGTGTPNVTLTIKKDWNNPDESSTTVKTVVTDSDGYYTVSLPLGNYTVIATKDGYTSSAFNIIVQEGTTSNQNGIITPLIGGDNYLITLRWGENPRDLDSHVVGTLSDGDRFHVYFADDSQYDGNVEVCNLDYDDTDGYGPEHITLITTTDAPYYYYIHRYAGSGAIVTSEAQITIEQGNVLIAKFNVPTDLSEEDYWNVFAIKNGEIIVNNTITSSPDTSYAS